MPDIMLSIISGILTPGNAGFAPPDACGCWRHWPAAAWLYTAQTKDRMAGVLRTAAPLQRWLDQEVGPDPRA
jgi:hypothetical protein